MNRNKPSNEPRITRSDLFIAAGIALFVGGFGGAGLIIIIVFGQW